MHIYERNKDIRSAEKMNKIWKIQNIIIRVDKCVVKHSTLAGL